jgi:flavin-dependent dehydrogenase
MLDYHVGIAGAGIGDSALATVLARAELSVLVLEKATEYRERARARQAEDPSLLHWFLAAFAGPEAVPAEAFDPTVRDLLLAFA